MCNANILPFAVQKWFDRKLLIKKYLANFFKGKFNLSIYYEVKIFLSFMIHLVISQNIQAKRQVKIQKILKRMLEYLAVRALALFLFD